MFSLLMLTKLNCVLSFLIWFYYTFIQFLFCHDSHQNGAASLVQINTTQIFSLLMLTKFNSVLPFIIIIFYLVHANSKWRCNMFLKNSSSKEPSHLNENRVQMYPTLAYYTYFGFFTFNQSWYCTCNGWSGAASLVWKNSAKEIFPFNAYKV